MDTYIATYAAFQNIMRFSTSIQDSNVLSQLSNMLILFVNTGDTSAEEILDNIFIEALQLAANEDGTSVSGRGSLTNFFY